MAVARKSPSVTTTSSLSMQVRLCVRLSSKYKIIHDSMREASNKTVTARIVDDFADPHWGEYGIGLSLDAFNHLGGVGTIGRVVWHVV
jgi:hypothetical protein